MGAIFSSNGSSGSTSGASNNSFDKSPRGGTCKRQRVSSNSGEGNERLIPCLPDEISLEVLARIPRVHYLKMKLVSRAWKSAILHSQLFDVRKQLGTTEEWLYILTKVEDDKLLWYALDPLNKIWQRLPTIPSAAYGDEAKKDLVGSRVWNMVGSGIKVADMVRSWLGRKGAPERMPFCGCAVGAVDGCLYVLGGFSKGSAMRCVWKYDPVVNNWNEVSPMTTDRAYSKTSVLDNKLYVVGGVNGGRDGLMPLQSAEVFDPQTGLWSSLPSMPFLKAQTIPTAFLADLLKPIATGVTTYRGKLYVAQSLYCWPFVVDVGGEVYDPETNEWVEMPSGMGDGWPPRQAGRKLSVTIEGELYALDPSGSVDGPSTKIQVYDYHEDTWKVVLRDVPICTHADSESHHLLTGLLGKLHVITKDANSNIAVLQAGIQNCVDSVASELAPEADNWRMIASRNAGSSELVNCLTLDV
ncbi:F-box/kelch-repeat protein At1g22040 [Linum perenne]